METNIKKPDSVSHARNEIEVCTVEAKVDTERGETTRERAKCRANDVGKITQRILRALDL